MMQESGKLQKPILIAGAGRNKLHDDAADKASERAIQAAIDGARGKIRNVAIDPVEIWLAADRAEERLEAFKIPVANRVGAVVYMKPEGPSAKSYKYPKNTIEAQIERKRDGWVLTHVGRAIVWPKQDKTEKLMLTPAQRDIAVERGADTRARGLWVQEPKTPKPQAQRAPGQGVGIGG